MNYHLFVEINSVELIQNAMKEYHIRGINFKQAIYSELLPYYI